MGLEQDIQKFINDNENSSYEIFRLKYSIESLNVDYESKKEAVNALEELMTYIKGLKYDVSDQNYLEKSRYFRIYDYIITHLYKLEVAKQEFNKFNKNLKSKYISQLLNLFKHLNKNPENPKKLAISILSCNHQRSDYFINLGVKKGFLDKEFQDYNPWKAEKKFEEILSYDEKLGYEIAIECKEKAFKHGEKALKNRPVLYLDEKALIKAKRYYKEKTLGEDGVESGALFHFQRLGDKRILLEDFESLETIDKRKTTQTKGHQETRFRGESGRDIIFCHSHPNLKTVSDRLSGGDIEVLKDPYDGVLATGLREGVTLLALPLPDENPPKEDIVWVACAVNSEGYAGNFPIHIVQNKEGSDLKKVDEKYSWVKIHNKWIKTSYSAKNEGPYSHYIEEKRLKNIRSQIQKRI